MFASPFLEGKKVGLWPLMPQDSLWLLPIINDQEVTRFMFTGRTPISRSMLEEQIAGWKEPSAYVFSLAPSAERGTRVGYTGLWDLDWISRKAEFRILVGPNHRGIGIGSDATQLMLRFAFDRLNLNRVWLGVNAAHAFAIVTYQKSGFRTEGRLLHDLGRDGEYFDSVRMAVLREEWLAVNHPDAFIRKCLCGCGARLDRPPVLYRWGHHARLNWERHFWAQVKKSEGCWEWQGVRDEKGYGWVGGGKVKKTPAHRFGYALVFGAIPDGYFVCHHCDNPPCVRPDHLWLGTCAENNRDMWAKGRGKSPASGGAFAGEKHPMAKLTRQQVEEIRLSPETDQQLAHRFGVVRQTITDIRKGRTWIDTEGEGQNA